MQVVKIKWLAEGPNQMQTLGAAADRCFTQGHPANTRLGSKFMVFHSLQLPTLLPLALVQTQ